MDTKYNDLFENEIEVNLEPLINETLDGPDVGTMESILLEALDLFDN